MSTIFPELEHQLEHAAERRHGGHHGWRGVRWAIPAIAVVAAVAVAIAVALPEAGDERPATGNLGAGNADPLTSAYTIFGPSGQAPDAATKEKLATEAYFAEAPPPMYRRTVAAGSEVVLAAGRLKVDGASVVCLYDVQHAGAGAACMSQDKLLSTDVPWVLSPDRTTVILVRDDVTHVRLDLADGSTRDLVPHDNVVVGSGEQACTIDWQRADGSRDSAPVAGAPSEGCG